MGIWRLRSPPAEVSRKSCHGEWCLAGMKDRQDLNHLEVGMWRAAGITSAGIYYVVWETMMCLHGLNVTHFVCSEVPLKENSRLGH